jgi:nucleoside-diphosphate-sugar epimerase
MSRFILQALTNQSITVYGDGKETRSLCYITDAVTALMLLTASLKAEREVSATRVLMAQPFVQNGQCLVMQETVA